MNDFLNFIKEYCKVLSDLVSLLEHKIKCIEINDISSLEDIMKKEQAFSLLLRGLDNKREKWQVENELQNQTFKQIIDCSCDDIQTDLQTQFNLLDSLLKQFNSLSKLAKSMLESKVYLVEKQIIDKTYTNSGKVRSVQTHKKGLHTTI